MYVRTTTLHLTRVITEDIILISRKQNTMRMYGHFHLGGSFAKKIGKYAVRTIVRTQQGYGEPLPG